MAPALQIHLPVEVDQYGGRDGLTERLVEKYNAVKNPNDKFYPGYSSYPSSEDIYINNIETNLDPEDILNEKSNP